MSPYVPSAADTPSYETLAWGVRVLKRLKVKKTLREPTQPPDRKSWIAPRTFSMPESDAFKRATHVSDSADSGYYSQSDYVRSPSPPLPNSSPAELEPIYFTGKHQNALVPQFRNIGSAETAFAPLDPLNQDQAKEEITFASCLANFPSQRVLSYEEAAFAVQAQVSSGSSTNWNVQNRDGYKFHPSSDTEIQQTPDTGLHELSGTDVQPPSGYVSPKKGTAPPSLRVLTQTENLCLAQGAIDEESLVKSATTKGPTSNRLTDGTAETISDWLVNVQINDGQTPSAAVDDSTCHSFQQSMSPISESAPPQQGSESCSPARLSELSVYESEGEASFVLGEDPIGWTTLEESAETSALISAFAKAFTSSYLANAGSPTDGQETSSEGSSASSSSSGNPTDKNSSLATTPTSVCHGSAQKRLLPGDNEEGPQRRKVPRASTPPTSGTEARLLACPYSKFDPRRYSERNELEKNYRGCSSCFLRDINRVKQHLYRVHRRPEHHCPYCFASFGCRQTLDVHIVARTCERQPSPFEEKMTPDELTAIKRRDLGRDRWNAWFDIYKILFPGAPLPVDPYVDSVHTSAVQQFMAFFEDEGREVLASEINWRMFGYAPPTPEHQLFVESVLTASIEVLIQRLEGRFRGTSS
ncbi:hypothetical protein PV04_02590 [Phialophora macrospora]|uniref:C2H2-type domain-containing protein n=1 Tax=Phialophora macrospora TaxID=1851006 RepID=A0A0D2FUW1_9EURO|nr:hypothetical protein PV04_02590 [Phialophora macrospora]